jgi:hypothetical protein
MTSTHTNKKARKSADFLALLDGAANAIRTHDLILTKEVRT